ncbi:MAG: DUF1848 domain-containing protein [Eubacteriales bacterium]|nr:DUF1848 domain-containing protein [Eubacteriales bacterium]
MILHTGLRTDIPAFYSEWFMRRVREGFVLVRSPYAAHTLTRYRIAPDVVDLISFCTKDPWPMLPHLEELRAFGQYWFVTVTPYGKEIEPNVPDKERVLEGIVRLSEKLGPRCVAWRYDPILLTREYDEQRHLEEFSAMARRIRGAVDVCVISFVDLYRKVQRNFPECEEISQQAKLRLGAEMTRIAAENGMRLKTCAEGEQLSAVGADTRGCMTMATFERALGEKLRAPAKSRGRKECACYLGADIGAYDTCGHLCRYCYANSDARAVRRNMSAQDSASPILCGTIGPEDTIVEARQESWRTGQAIWDIL